MPDALVHSAARALIKVNLTRKLIRWPALFRRQLVSAIYSWSKGLQAAFFKDALERYLSDLESSEAMIIV